MREWSLKQGDPLALSIAADARLYNPSYIDDQIWEILLSSGEPASLSLYTNYGLRARSMRIFPMFTEGDTTKINPLEFESPPTVRQFYPNFIKITFSPFPDLEVTAEYWVPQSQVVAGHFQVTNIGAISKRVRLELAANLIPMDGGERMGSNESRSIQFLSGRTSDLIPVFYLNGGVISTGGFFPALLVSFDLTVGESTQLFWSIATTHSLEESYELARNSTLRPWDSEHVKIEMVNAGNIEIHTGDKNWDSAFALSQKVALGLIHGPSVKLPKSTFVLSRRPEDGFSLSGDGLDHRYLWNGQSAFETLQMMNYLLPATPELMVSLIDNFLSTQREDGFVDLKPGMGGQQSNQLVSPVLAYLVLQCYQITKDIIYLDEVFPKLVKYYLFWFNKEDYRVTAGIPIWDSLTQTCFDTHPLFSKIHNWAKDLDISTVGNPSLCALLYQEGKILIQIAEILGRLEVKLELLKYSNQMEKAVKDSWDNNVSSYQYWYVNDDSHTSINCLDQSLLLPLWTGIPSQEIADQLIQKTITSPGNFWQSYGLPASPVKDSTNIPDERWNVHILWNSIIGEGLLRYGYYSECANLLTHLMQAIITSLKSEAAFRTNYDSRTGQGSGERNTLYGLAPLGLFLKTIGVSIQSPLCVKISGSNPFPWPVTVKYRGLTVIRQKNKTMVIFPSGQTINVKQSKPCLVTCE